MSRPPEDQPFDRPVEQPFGQPADGQVPSYGTPPSSDSSPAGVGPTPYAPTPYDAPVPGSAPGYGTPPPEHRPYAVGSSTGRRRPGSRARLITSLLPLLAIVLFFAFRGNGIGPFWIPLGLVLVIGVVTQVVRRGTHRD